MYQGITTFDDLSDEEVLKLTDEQISRYVDLQCAIDGVPILPVLPVPPVKPDIKKDCKLFEIEGSIYVGSKEDADKIIEVLSSVETYRTEYVNGASFERKAVKNDYGFDSKVKYFYSEKTFEKSEKELTKYEAENAKYKEFKNGYDNINAKRNDISDHIYSRVQELRNLEAEKQSMITKFYEYLRLAENNRQVAYSFLVRSYPKVENYKEIFNLDEVTTVPEED